jgi:hypothetical protein
MDRRVRSGLHAKEEPRQELSRFVNLTGFQANLEKLIRPKRTESYGRILAIDRSENLSPVKERHSPIERAGAPRAG